MDGKTIVRWVKGLTKVHGLVDMAVAMAPKLPEPAFSRKKASTAPGRLATYQCCGIAAPPPELGPAQRGEIC